VSIERELSWSSSRVDIFSRCQLEYYFTYYLSHGGWEKGADKRVRDCYLLKHTKNRYAWMGDLVHQTLEHFLNQCRKGERLSREAVIAFGDQQMRREFRESRDQQYRLYPNRCVGLVEHENNMPVTDEQWKRIHENLVTCLGNFFYTDFYKTRISETLKPIFKIERLEHFFLDNIKVYAKPDVAFKEEDRLHIIDWKTGAAHDEHEFQLYYYVLFGVHKLGFNAEQIDADIIYLKDNTLKQVEIRPEYLEGAKDHLNRTFDKMRLFDEAVRQGLQEAELPVSSSKNTCCLCRFQKLCG